MVPEPEREELHRLYNSLVQRVELDQRTVSLVDQIATILVNLVKALVENFAMNRDYILGLWRQEANKGEYCVCNDNEPHRNRTASADLSPILIMALEMHSNRPTVQIEVQARVFDVVGEHLALLVQIIVHLPVHYVFGLFLALGHFDELLRINTKYLITEKISA